MKIWFISDIHGYHRNIAGPKVSVWKDGYRNFTDEIEMTEHIITNINKYVNYDDILYNLGDWTFGNVYNVKRLRDQINCQTIHSLYGNHCGKIRANKEIITDNDVFYPKDCFTSIQDVLTIVHGKHTFFLSHYSHRIWLGSHKGFIHLFGHSHGGLDDKPWGRSMDVGIDSAYKITGEYRPFSIEEIISIMDKREIKFIDKHDENTNVK